MPREGGAPSKRNRCGHHSQPSAITGSSAFADDDTDNFMTDEAQGGRIFFSSTGRTFGEEDELCVLSVGVDIGSSTSHLVFSRIVLERLDSRYVVTERESFYQSEI